MAVVGAELDRLDRQVRGAVGATGLFCNGETAIDSVACRHDGGAIDGEIGLKHGGEAGSLLSIAGVDCVEHAHQEICASWYGDHALL